MMSFAEKLAFLMRLSQTSNKELAAALDVNPSMISLMRGGRRKLPRDPAQGKKIAAFMAQRCSAPFQRRALSETLEQVSISPNMPVDVLASILEAWLRGESNTLADSFLSGIETQPISAPELPPSSPAPVPVGTEKTRFFFGPEGRQEVMKLVMQACRQMEEPGTILTVVDDNLEWLLSDYVLTRSTQIGLLELLDQGFTIHQIVPPMNYVNRYAESLRFWLPLYATGKATAYYYPRLRGNLYRHSIIVVPGCCVQYAAAVGLGSTSEITMFSTDPKLVEVFKKQFEEHVSLCRPALTVHRAYEDVLACFRDFSRCRGSAIALVNSLSLCTMPRALLERYIHESGVAMAKETFRVYLEEIPSFEASLAADTYIDMCRLATADEIRSGAVQVASSGKGLPGQPVYTPETYCLHLKNILRLMDEYENYCFLPVDEKEYPDYHLFVKEDGLALIIRTAEPFMTMEVRRQSMVSAFGEHLLRRADAAECTAARKEKVRMELRTLIQQLTGPARGGK